jgi:hypothetical protein
MKEQTRQPSDCTICGSMKLTQMESRILKWTKMEYGKR